MSSSFPSSNNGEQANFPFQRIEDVYSKNTTHPRPTDGLDDYIQSRASTPCLLDPSQPMPFETTTMTEISPDEFYGAMHSSNRLKAIEADLARTLMSDMNVLDSSLPICSPLDLLTDRRPTYNLFNGDKICPTPNTTETERELSTEEIMRVAGIHFIQFSANHHPHPAVRKYPFGFSLSFSSMSPEEICNVALASLLLAAAEKLNKKYFERARSLINRCCCLSSSNGNPVQRVVHHFAAALQERVERETDKLLSRKGPRETIVSNVNKLMLAANSLQLAYHEKVPFSQLLQFISVQTIIDVVGSQTRVHVIDFSLRHGLQWSVLIQELATRTTFPVEYLKITAVGASADAIARSGEQLKKFAQTMGLNFKFETVIVKEITELSEEMFNRGVGEVLAIYFSICINTMIVSPGDLEHLMKVSENLKPEVMTVVDVEGKHNSTSFITRFTEALFFYSAVFDSMDVFMERNDPDRMLLEGRFFSEGIKSIVAAEGKDRVVRHVGIMMWRSFFARFGLAECELNEWSLYQAGLIAKQFQNGALCSLHKNEKSLMVGWKGTPLFFISAWKFL